MRPAFFRRIERRHADTGAGAALAIVIGVLLSLVLVHGLSGGFR